MVTTTKGLIDQEQVDKFRLAHVQAIKEQNGGVPEED